MPNDGEKGVSLGEGVPAKLKNIGRIPAVQNSCALRNLTIHKSGMILPEKKSAHENPIKIPNGLMRQK